MAKNSIAVTFIIGSQVIKHISSILCNLCNERSFIQKQHIAEYTNCMLKIQTVLF